MTLLNKNINGLFRANRFMKYMGLIMLKQYGSFFSVILLAGTYKVKLDMINDNAETTGVDSPHIVLILDRNNVKLTHCIYSVIMTCGQLLTII